MFTTDDFSYKNRVFTAEASDFKEHEFKLMFPPHPGEMAFVLISSRTGNKVKMMLHKTHMEEAHHEMGDVTHWEWHPYDNDSFDAVIVFND